MNQLYQQYRLLGCKSIHYTNKQGREITGKTCYFGLEIPSNQGTGLETMEVFISRERENKFTAHTLEVGDSYCLVYNRFGSIVDIFSCEEDLDNDLV